MSNPNSKKEKAVRWAKYTFFCVAAFQGVRLLFALISGDGNTAASAVVVIVFGGAIFSGFAYLLGYISGD
jgi:hypothetical protein